MSDSAYFRNIGIQEMSSASSRQPSSSPSPINCNACKAHKNTLEPQPFWLKRNEKWWMDRFGEGLHELAYAMVPLSSANQHRSTSKNLIFGFHMHIDCSYVVRVQFQSNQPNRNARKEKKSSRRGCGGRRPGHEKRPKKYTIKKSNITKFYEKKKKDRTGNVAA